MDEDGDMLSFCWEQMDNDSSAQSPVNTSTYFLLRNNNIDKLVIGVNDVTQLEENIKEIYNIPILDMKEVDFSLFRIKDEKYTNPVNWKK